MLDALRSRGASANVYSNIAETPLSIAVRGGPPLTTIHKLISWGANVREGNLLHCAVERQQQSGDVGEVIALLISHGASIEQIQFSDPRAYRLRGHLTRGTPLHLACRRGNLAAAEILLRYGASPFSTGCRYAQEDSTTPMEIAKGKGDDAMVALLESASGQGF